MAKNDPDWLADAEAKAAFMKRHNASSAKWTGHDADMLESLTLAPAPAAPRLGPAAQLVKALDSRGAPPPDPKLAEAERRHRIMFAASSMVPSFDPPQPPPSAVPRAVRAKEAGRADQSKTRR